MLNSRWVAGHLFFIRFSLIYSFCFDSCSLLSLTYFSPSFIKIEISYSVNECKYCTYTVCRIMYVCVYINIELLHTNFLCFTISGLISLFYLIFYACLAGIFVSMLAIFLNCVIQDDVPKLTGMQSLLKLNPGKWHAYICLLYNLHWYLSLVIWFQELAFSHCPTTNLLWWSTKFPIILLLKNTQQ